MKGRITIFLIPILLFILYMFISANIKIFNSNLHYNEESEVQYPEYEYCDIKYIFRKCSSACEFSRHKIGNMREHKNATFDSSVGIDLMNWLNGTLLTFLLVNLIRIYLVSDFKILKVIDKKFKL